MFSWMSKDEERKKNADVYSSVTAGLQNVYKTKLLPLEKVFFYFLALHILGNVGQVYNIFTKLKVRALILFFRNIIFTTFTHQLSMIQISMPGLWSCWLANIPRVKPLLLDIFLNKISQELELDRNQQQTGKLNLVSNISDTEL